MNDNEDRYAPLDPYREGLTQLRAASAAPAPSDFERDYKLDRLIALNTEYADIAEGDARAAEAAERLGCAVHELRILSDDGAASYAPRNPYAAGIKKLQEAR